MLDIARTRQPESILRAHFSRSWPLGAGCARAGFFASALGPGLWSAFRHVVAERKKFV